MNKIRFALLAGMLILGGCSGPQAPIDVGAKEVPIDLLLGARVRAVAQAAVPPLGIPTTPSGFISFRPTPPPTGGVSSIAAPAGPCPEADPLAVPKRVAPNKIAAPPKPGNYTARTVGRMRVGGADAQDVLLAPSSTVAIGNIVAESTGGFTYDSTVTNGNAATTTTYRVLPVGAAAESVPVPGIPDPNDYDFSPLLPPGAPNPWPFPPPPEPPIGRPKPEAAAPGLYVTRVSSPGSPPFEASGAGIIVARLPLTIGHFVDGSGTDGTTTTSWRATVKSKETVDACGTPIDTYRIELTEGKSADGTEVVDFTSVLNIGTQYGGLALFHKTEAAGSQGPTAISRSVQLTFDSEPAAI